MIKALYAATDDSQEHPLTMDETTPEGIPEKDSGMYIAVSANPETWFPMIICAMPADAEDIQDGLIPLVISPQVALRMAAGLIQTANMVLSFNDELADKTVEERREILMLESSLIESPFTN